MVNLLGLTPAELQAYCIGHSEDPRGVAHRPPQHHPRVERRERVPHRLVEMNQVVNRHDQRDARSGDDVVRRVKDVEAGLFRGPPDGDHLADRVVRNVERDVLDVRGEVRAGRRERHELVAAPQLHEAAQ